MTKLRALFLDSTHNVLWGGLTDGELEAARAVSNLEIIGPIDTSTCYIFRGIHDRHLDWQEKEQILDAIASAKEASLGAAREKIRKASAEYDRACRYRKSQSDVTWMIRSCLDLVLAQRELAALGGDDDQP